MFRGGTRGREIRTRVLLWISAGLLLVSMAIMFFGAGRPRSAATATPEPAPRASHPLPIGPVVAEDPAAGAGSAPGTLEAARRRIAELEAANAQWQAQMSSLVSRQVADVAPAAPAAALPEDVAPLRQDLAAATNALAALGARLSAMEQERAASEQAGKDLEVKLAALMAELAQAQGALAEKDLALQQAQAAVDPPRAAQALMAALAEVRRVKLQMRSAGAGADRADLQQQYDAARKGVRAALAALEKAP